MECSDGRAGWCASSGGAKDGEGAHSVHLGGVEDGK